MYLFPQQIEYLFTEYRLKMRNTVYFPKQFAAFQILYIHFLFQKQPETLLEKNPTTNHNPNWVDFYTV